jgi:hypothetical protein
MNTIDGAGINGLLNNFFSIPVLTNYPRSPIVGLDIKGIAGHMGTVLTADASNFININPFLPPLTAQFRL